MGQTVAAATGATVSAVSHALSYAECITVVRLSIADFNCVHGRRQKTKPFCGRLKRPPSGDGERLACSSVCNQLYTRQKLRVGLHVSVSCRRGTARRWSVYAEILITASWDSTATDGMCDVRGTIIGLVPYAHSKLYAVCVSHWRSTVEKRRRRCDKKACRRRLYW